MKLKQKVKLGIVLGVEFVTIAVILALIFFAGKKSYTVTFDPNGGTLISGDLVQTVPQGKNATPPNVAKDGCYLHSWSASYRQITRDIVIEAVWEWQTSIGFDYVSGEDSNYCEILSCFKDLTGDVYVGVYHDEKKVLGIRNDAFRDCDGIENIYMLDGILSIGESVFEGCDSLVTVELPGTLSKLGKNAFKDCVSLEKIVIPDNLKVIPEGAFAGCTSLKEIVIPSTVVTIEPGAFAGCTSLEKVTFVEQTETEVDEETGEETTSYTGIVTIGGGAFAGCESLTEVVLPSTLKNIGELAFSGESLVIRTPLAEEDKPEGWAPLWHGDAAVEWEYDVSVPEPEEEPAEKHGWLS